MEVNSDHGPKTDFLNYSLISCMWHPLLNAHSYPSQAILALSCPTLFEKAMMNPKMTSVSSSSSLDHVSIE